MVDLVQAQARLGHALDHAHRGEGRVLAAVVREEGSHFVELLEAALAQAPAEEPSRGQALRDLEGVLGRLVALLGAVHLLTAEDRAYVNEIRISSEGTQAAQTLGSRLRGHGVEGVSFHTPLGEAQLRALLRAVAASPDPDRPRAALQTALAAQGLDSVVLVGLPRHEESHEEEATGTRDARAVAAAAAALADQARRSLAARHTPNPLPLRRVVIEILETGAGAPWDDPEDATLYAAHAVRVCRLALLLGRALGLPEGALQDLGVAALLHDVGYAAEGATFARHSTAGARLLLRQRGFHEAKVRRVLAALDHHRRYDDPHRRPALLGRMLAITEDYDTLVQARGGGLGAADALGRLSQAAGTVYDPVLVQLFANTLDRFPPGTLVTPAEGRQARAPSASPVAPEPAQEAAAIVAPPTSGSEAPSEAAAEAEAAPFRDWTPLPDEPTHEERAPAPPAAPGVLSAAPRPLFPGAVPQLLRDIYTGKRSGFLTLIRGHERRGVRFWNGSIMYGRSSVHEEQMGGLAVQLGLLTEEDLERASGIARRENERLGEVLCGLGLLTTGALKDLVARHARQVLEKALPWTKGSYQFEPTREEPTWFERMPSSLSTADIILDAARAIEDPEVIAWHLGDVDRVVIPAEAAAVEASACRLTAFDGFVLSRADGQLTAREIVSVVPKDADDVLRALFGLMCIGFVRYGSHHATRS